MFNDIIQILYLLVASGAAGAIINLLMKQAKNHKLHAALALANELVSSKVTKYALDPSTPPEQRKTAVARELEDELQKHGYQLKISTLEELAQTEYQNYKVNGKKIIIPSLAKVTDGNITLKGDDK